MNPKHEHLGPHASPGEMARAPRAHLAGTLALVRRFSRLAGSCADLGPLMELLDRPAALPVRVGPRDIGLKYDAYVSVGRDRTAWGLTINDRYEGPSMAAAVDAFLDALPGNHRRDVIRAFAASGVVPRAVVTLAVGFDHPDGPPRLKVYLQEDRWGAGVCTAERFRRLAAELAPTCALPVWLPDDARIGVLSAETWPRGGVGLRAYLGGSEPLAAARGGPPEAVDLALRMGRRSRMPGGYYYLTIRVRPGQPCAYAMNRIYDTGRILLGDPDGLWHDAWLDVGRQLRAAGQRATFGRLLREVTRLPGVRVVPTATSLEAGGHRADVYCAAWRVGASA